MLKRLIILLSVFILLLSLTEVSLAANTDNHAVTIQVSAINEVSISGGGVTLTINSATAGSEPNSSADNTTCDLLWTTNQTNKKITVVSSLGAPKFTLKALAENVSGGTAASEATLSTTAADFVTGIATTTGNCDIKYTASATASAGTGTDSHTITYTLTDI
ncbi:hypothetical protein JXL19_06595 [bacterium]|nr:hypothetical protein [bacterium]